MLRVRQYKGTSPKTKGSHNETKIKTVFSKEYTIDKNGKMQQDVNGSRGTHAKGSIKESFNIIQEGVARFLADLFLPVGYPESVEASYLKYQAYDSLQGLCSYLRGVVSTSAVLSAAGVGNSEVTALSAAITWALRDGVGMIGGLLFSYISATHFDSHVKEFRLFADVINDVGLTLDMVAPLFHPERVIYISAIATICKVMCGMAAGATKASITAHFALRGNMADLNAKESTQETLVTLIGMTFGISLANYVNNLDPYLANYWIWVVFIILTIIHVWANYKGVMLLRLNTLNRQRSEDILEEKMSEISEEMVKVLQMRHRTEQDGYFETLSLSFSTIKTPNQVSESIIESTKKLLFSGNIRLGASILEICSSAEEKHNLWLLTEEFLNDKYVLAMNVLKGRVYVALKNGATEWDEWISFTHALLVSRYLSQSKFDAKSAISEREIIKVSHKFIRHIYGLDVDSSGTNTFLTVEKLSQSGWSCERIYLGFGKYRIDYSMKLD